MLSHWLTEAGPSVAEETAPALEGDARADICIVGGGFCGLWTALRLKERDPAIDVAIVEKDECGSGASGRNGGFVLSWWAKFGSLCKFCPSDEAARLARASADAVGEIGRFCTENGIDAHYRGDGWLWAASNQAQDDSWNALVDTLERHQLHPFELWERETVKRRSGTDRHVSGVYEPTGATVQPALLARGLRSVALAKGVRIYERTPLDPARPRPPAPRDHAARHGGRRQGGHRHERVVDHVPGAEADHPGDRERYRRDEADAGPSRRLRLERRDVHLGFPYLGELLPAHHGRARRLRHRRRAALLRQQGGRALQRRFARAPARSRATSATSTRTSPTCRSRRTGPDPSTAP